MKQSKKKNTTSKNEKQTLYPVILTVPHMAKALTPKERVKFLSRHARKALEMSAVKSRIRLGELEKDDRNAPLPFKGTYWSVTHKNEYVGGIVAPSTIGIDIERICPRDRALFRKTASEAEWALADKTFETFFRYWTAKEAVLKASGTGLRDLSECTVLRILDAHRLDIEYDGKRLRIEHHFFNHHIASIVKNDFVIKWTVC